MAQELKSRQKILGVSQAHKDASCVENKNEKKFLAAWASKRRTTQNKNEKQEQKDNIWEKLSQAGSQDSSDIVEERLQKF